MSDAIVVSSLVMVSMYSPLGRLRNFISALPPLAQFIMKFAGLLLVCVVIKAAANQKAMAIIAAYPTCLFIFSIAVDEYSLIDPGKAL